MQVERYPFKRDLFGIATTGTAVRINQCMEISTMDKDNKLDCDQIALKGLMIVGWRFVLRWGAASVRGTSNWFLLIG